MTVGKGKLEIVDSRLTRSLVLRRSVGSLRRSLPSQVKTTYAKSGFSYGIAKVKGDWLYRGTSAAAQLTNRPTFVLVSQIDVSTQAIALVRFDVKKDHRETQYCEAGAWSGVKEENKDTIPLTVTRQPNTNTLTITPASDLPAGEYLLIADQGKGYDGYNFSVK
jgi:hypothetical protein